MSVQIHQQLLTHGSSLCNRKVQFILKEPLCLYFLSAGRWSHTGSLKATPSAPPSPNRRRSSRLRWSLSEYTFFFFFFSLFKMCFNVARWTQLENVSRLPSSVCQWRDAGPQTKDTEKLLPIKRGQVQRWGLCPKGRAGQILQMKRNLIHCSLFVENWSAHAHVVFQWQLEREEV